MGKRRKGADYHALLDIVGRKLRETAKTLKEVGYESRRISPKEFYDYMTGETPTRDTITIADVLDREFLMIHEVVEISELKKMGLPIDRHTAMRFLPSVYNAHYTATEHELDYALSRRDYAWLEIRLDHVTSWLEDDHLPEHLVPRCKAIISRLSEALPR